MIVYGFELLYSESRREPRRALPTGPPEPFRPRLSSSNLETPTSAFSSTSAQYVHDRNALNSFPVKLLRTPFIATEWCGLLPWSNSQTFKPATFKSPFKSFRIRIYKKCRGRVARSSRFSNFDFRSLQLWNCSVATGTTTTVRAARRTRPWYPAANPKRTDSSPLDGAEGPRGARLPQAGEEKIGLKTGHK
jgi:hypothetical protein